MLTLRCLYNLFLVVFGGPGFGAPSNVLLPLTVLAGALLQLALLSGGRKWWLPIAACAGLLACELLGVIIGGYFLLVLVIIVTYLLAALIGAGVGAAVYQGIVRSRKNKGRNAND